MSFTLADTMHQLLHFTMNGNVSAQNGPTEQLSQPQTVLPTNTLSFRSHASHMIHLYCTL